MLLAEGQFNAVDGSPYNIKFEKKSGDNDQFLENVTIHVKGNDGRTNATVIKSRTGELASDKDSNVLKLILNDGHDYSDVSPKDRKAKNRKPFVKSTFETKIINIDLSKLNNVDFDEQAQTDKYSMLNVSGLNKTIDSLIIKYNDDHETFSKNLLLRSGLNKKELPNKTAVDSSYSGPVLELFNTKKKIEMVDLALKSMTSSKQFITSRDTSTKNSKAWLNRHVISLHEKFALGFACVILFFVGAPLGALIRKGGIGLPMVIAILLFLTYHFIGIFATNSAKSGDFNPIIAPWFSTLVMFPLGFFLTQRATADKGLFEFDNVLEPIKKAFRIKDKNSIDYKFLSDHKNEELVDVINNYDTLGYHEGSSVFVPYSDVRGKVGTKLSVLSRYRISDAVRHQIPANGNIFAGSYNPFELARNGYGPQYAVLEIRMPVVNGESLAVLTTDLDLYEHADSLIERVDRVEHIVSGLDLASVPWVLGGDFNLLPNEQQYDDLPLEHQKWYTRDSDIVEFDYVRFPSGDQTSGSDRSSFFTFFSNDPAIDGPDRTLDYVFVSETVELVSGQVLSSGSAGLSDHLPVFVTIAVPDN